MGRLILSNKYEWISELEKCAQKAGFISSHNNYNDSTLVSYRKLNVNNENFYSKGDYFVTVNGTFIYDKKIGRKALECVLECFIELKNHCGMEDVIKYIRKKTIGNYVVVIGTQENKICFVDEMGCYAFYYYASQSHYVLTNTYYHIAKITGVRPNIMGLFDKYSRGGNSYNETPFLSIFRIMPNEYLLISKSSIEKKVCLLNHYNTPINDMHTVMTALEKELRELSKLKFELFGNMNTLVFLTGGVDSRVELSLYQDKTKNLLIGYWTGKDLITNGTKPDADISRKIADVINSKFTLIDVGQDYSDVEADMWSDWDKYGEYANIYAHNRKWLNIPRNIGKDVGFVLYGYFGEALQNLDVLDDTYDNNFSFLDFVTKVYCRSGMEKKVFRDAKFYEYISNEIKKLSNCFEHDDEKKGNQYQKTDYLNLFNLTRTHADAGCYNYVNMYNYGFSIFTQKKIYDLVEQIPASHKNNAALSLLITKTFNPKLTRIEYYTHHQYRKYNDKKKCLVKPFKYRIINFMHSIVKTYTNTFIYNKIRNYAHTMRELLKGTHSSNAELLKQVNNIMKQSNFVAKYASNFLFPQTTQGFVIESYAQLATEIKMIDKICGEK